MVKHNQYVGKLFVELHDVWVEFYNKMYSFP